MFLAAIYFYKTLRPYVGVRSATVATYAMALWPAAMKVLPQVMTEPLSVLLVCGFIFHFTRMHRSEERRRTHLILAAAYLGYLALTRVVFGYVIPAALGVLLVVYLVRRYRPLGRNVLVFGLALAVCLPYLIYTHSITGKAYYWGTSGGMSLYWMSSPFEGEMGDWHTMRATIKNPELAKNHGAFLADIGNLKPVEKDDALKQRAIQNIRENPGKYFKNWIANLGRLAINYPRSYTEHKQITLLDIVPSMFLIVLCTLCLYPTYRRRYRIPHEIWVLLLVGLLYLGGSSLLSAFHRFQLPLVPIALLWVSYVVGRIIRIEML
jgi:hypothetical protein